MSQSKFIIYNPPQDSNKKHKEHILKGVIKFLISFFYPLIGYPLVYLNSVKSLDKKYNVCICAIFKDEGIYLKEWIDFHLTIGVEHFFLYNNFSSDNYHEILKPYVQNGLVELIEWPVKYGQNQAYEDCYTKYNNLTKWIGFIDLDEFICLLQEDNILDWLNKYERFPSVLINWKIFGTSGLINHDNSKFVIEQYTSCWPQLVNVGKSFINTNFVFEKFVSPHFFHSSKRILGINVIIPPINEFKKFVLFWIHKLPFRKAQHSIQINHYWSKAYNSFMYKDKIRGSALCSDNDELRKSNLNRRFEYHEQKNIAHDLNIQRFLKAFKENKY